MAGVDLLSRIATEDDDDYTYKNSNKYNNIYDDDNNNKLNKRKSKRSNGYETVELYAGDTIDCNNINSRNPFDEVNIHFKNERDPESYIGVYKRIKLDIKLIQNNIDSVSKLRDNFNLSDSQKQYQSIMNELDNIMMNNSRLTRKIKESLSEEKIKNDALESSGDHRSSSILQWRINKLNSCVGEFKLFASSFEKELNETQNALKQKEKRKLIEFDEKNELNEEKIDYMVDHPEQLESFLQKKFEGMAASDALLERVHELEDRHQGMIKIEKSIKELQEMWMELNVLVTEQQEMLDHITRNVEETRDYVKSATKHLQKAEENQKCSRKLQMYACCCCLIILVILVIALGAGGIFT
eukprot:237895_1